MTSVDRFLQEKADDGVFESSREFSVNLVAAQQKMGRYVLPRQSAWLLKFVQSATEMNSTNLALGLEKDRIVVKFSPNTFRPIPELRFALDTLRPENLGEDHLFGGLLALHALKGEVYYEDGSSRWFPAETRELKQLDTAVLSPRVVYAPRPGRFWERLKARIWRTSELLGELKENCYCCPVKLTVDSLPLRHGDQDVPLLSGLIKGEAGSDLDYYGQLERDTGKKNLTYCHWGSSRPQQIGFAVQLRVHSRRIKSTLSLEWIRSGAVVKRTIVDLDGSSRLIARILIPTRGLKFDVTGFAIKDDEQSRARQALGATYLEHAVEAVKGELNRHDRWNKFLQQNYPQARVPRIETLVDQLDQFIDLGKHRFSRRH